jgi:dTDP-4-amino-4,6-dideoxygalactose transaminase
MQALGHNYRASELHCALGASQLTKLGRFVVARRALVAGYDRLLAPVVTPLSRRPGTIPAWYLYVVRVDFAALGLDRATVIRALAAQGIGSQVHYMPLHLQPYYRRLCGPLALRGAEAYYRACLSLPLFPAMTEEDVARVAATLGALVGTRVGA